MSNSDDDLNIFNVNNQVSNLKCKVLEDTDASLVCMGNILKFTHN